MRSWKTASGYTHSWIRVPPSPRGFPGRPFGPAMNPSSDTPTSTNTLAMWLPRGSSRPPRRRPAGGDVADLHQAGRGRLRPAQVEGPLRQRRLEEPDPVPEHDRDERERQVVDEPGGEELRDHRPAVDVGAANAVPGEARHHGLRIA